jgi:hypothetical protein
MNLSTAHQVVLLLSRLLARGASAVRRAYLYPPYTESVHGNVGSNGDGTSNRIVAQSNLCNLSYRISLSGEEKLNIQGLPEHKLV